MSFLITESQLDITEMTDLIVHESDSTNGELNTGLLSISDDYDCGDSGGDGDGGGGDIFQTTQVKLIQIPSNANVIQVPSNLLVTSNNNNLILCLPSEGITFQVQSTPLIESSSMETNVNEIYDSSNCNNQTSSFTTLTPITFPEMINKQQQSQQQLLTTYAFGESIEITPEIQLEKAQTWHRDSQLAIVALAALKSTKVTPTEDAM